MDFIGTTAPFGGGMWGRAAVGPRPAAAPYLGQPVKLNQRVSAEAEAVGTAEEQEVKLSENYDALVEILGPEKAALAIAQSRGSVAVAREDLQRVEGR